MNKISAVLITYNEASQLKDCLMSLQGFADEIIAIDLGSSDGTVAMLREYKAQVFTHPWVPYADPIRNELLDKAGGDWIIMLDPDERLTPKLTEFLKEFIQAPGDYVAANIPFKNVFWGHWISHSNFWPDKHIRFFKKGSVVWKKEVHSYPHVNGLVLEAPNKEELAIKHFGYDNHWQFIQKQWRYSTSAAWNKLASGEGFSAVALFWQPLREFLARYIKHQGFKDGSDGLFLVAVLMIYQILVQLKLFCYSFSRQRRPY